MPRRAKSGSWVYPSSAVVDSLVDYLRRTDRWRKYGPVLRLLSRQWERRIDQKITEIRPASCRAVSREDMASLLKFPFLTSLDVTPFLLALRRRPPFSVPSSEGEVQRLVHVLRQLKSLTRIEIESGRLALGNDRSLNRGRRPWARLKSIQSVFIYQGKNPKLSDGGRHEVEYPFGYSYEANVDLTPFLWQFTGLKQLTVFFSTAWKCMNWACLEKLEAVQLQTVSSPSCVRSCPEPKYIRSAAFEEPTSEDLELLTRLPGLRSLRLRSTETWPEFSVEAMRCLECLDLSPPASHSLLTDIHSWSRLQCLTLRQIRFNIEELIEQLTNLKTLRLIECFLEGSSASEPRTKQLQNLAVVDMEFGSEELSRELVTAVLPDLASLTVGSRMLERLLVVTKARNLETLSLAVGDMWSYNTLKELWRLPKLKKLTLRCVIKMPPYTDRLSGDVLNKLERLTLAGFEKTTAVTNWLKQIQSQAPCLMIEWLVYGSYSFETQLV